MCTNQKRVYNKYTKRWMYVNCGHCPACLQQKASYRVQRIKNNDSVGLQCYMLSLTYARYNAPYIKRDEAYLFSKGELDKLTVYRDVTYRWKRYGKDYDMFCCGEKITQKLCDIDYSDDICSIVGVKDLKHEFNKIGVCYYPDLQKFFARLRLNLIRNFNYNEKFSAYCCSEYGGSSYRPHFHILLWIRKADSEIFRAAINKSWPFSNLLMFPRAFEEAHRAASYVSSYVNCGTNFPKFLKKTFPPKHSYSKGFGCGNKLFSLPSVLQKFQSGHLTYFSQKVREGIPNIVECLIPKYIIHRYFPLVKGYSSFTGTSQCYYLLGFTKCLDEYEKSECGRFWQIGLSDTFDSFSKYWSFGDFYQSKFYSRLHYDIDEIVRIGKRIRNAYSRFCECSNVFLSLWDYLLLHQKIWGLYHSDCLRLHLQNEEVPLNEKYDNLDFVKDEYQKSFGLPIGFSDDMLLVVNPNDFKSVGLVTRRYEDDFYRYTKNKNVANVVMSSDCEEF